MKNLIRRWLQRLARGMIGFGIPPFIEDSRTSGATQAALISHMAQLQSLARAGRPLPRIEDAGFRIFSQFEEDGLLLYLIALLEIDAKIFVDIGAADGVFSNCANLALNLGWHGVFLDGNPDYIAQGRAFYARRADIAFYPPVFKQAMVDRDNINKLIEAAGFEGEIGVLSIDIDGNDYWVWEAISVVSPAIVIMEANTVLGLKDLVMPYDPKHRHPGRHPDHYGASVAALTSLAKRKGYRLVAANRLGLNLLFVRNGLFEERIPEIPVEIVAARPRFQEQQALFSAIANLPFTSPNGAPVVSQIDLHRP